jgi:hypothetical protein
LDYKLTEHPDPQVGKLLKTQQLGIQYLLYLQELAKKRALLYAQESAKEREMIVKLKEIKKKQENKIKELEKRVD